MTNKSKFGAAAAERARKITALKAEKASKPESKKPVEPVKANLIPDAPRRNTYARLLAKLAASKNDRQAK